MKKIMIAVIVACIAVLGCSKNTPKPNPTNPTNPTGTLYSMSAKINGVPFSRDSCLFEQSLTDSEFVYVLGWAGESKTLPNYYPHIRIDLFPFRGNGVYAKHHTTARYTTSDTESELTDSCMVTITETYPNVKGTFNIVVPSGKIIDGSFTALRTR